MTEEQEHGAPEPGFPRLVAAGVGAAWELVDALAEFGAEAVQTAIGRTKAAEHRYHEAASRGDVLIGRAVAGMADRFDRAVGSAAAWTDRELVRRVAESMTPYLIDDLVPRVIDGVMPKIRADVVPAVLEDLADDEHIQTMVASQSKGMLSRGVEEVRQASADADDRVEAGMHRLFGRQGADE
jgi:hypothetical protein